MTQTGRWLAARRAQLAWRELVGLLLAGGGGVFAVLAGGVWLARVGLYRQLPATVLLGWVAAGGLMMLTGAVYRRRNRAIAMGSIAAELEREGGLRRGSILGMSEPPATGSEALIRAADRSARRWLDAHGRRALAPAMHRGTKSLWVGVLVGVMGLSLFGAARPTDGAGASFWRPDALLLERPGAVSLSVNRDEVRRGERVTATITAPGSRTVSLWSRIPGEQWESTSLDVDSAGGAEVVIGPLESDRFLRASSGRRESEIIHIRVALPAFINELTLTARFPTYVDRADEQLFSGDSVLLPEGTRLLVRGRATVPVASAAWRVGGSRRPPVELATDGPMFTGQTAVWVGGAWELVVEPAGGAVLDEPAPVLYVTVVADSAPVVAIPLPGVDTVAPPSLQQPLVIDVRDDYRVIRAEVMGRRASGAGAAGHAWVDTLFLPEGGLDRAILPWMLDLNHRGFLPGDTAYYRVRAYDNAPKAHQGESPEYALRLPSESELRRAVRDAAASLAREADSLREAQQDLAEETENLAASGARESTQDRAQGSAAEQGLEFQSAERAGEIGEEQDQLIKRAEELSRRLDELSETGWEAGLTDQEWHQQLQDLQSLLDDALTPELMDALEQLGDALEQLDPEAVQEALEQLAARQKELEEQLERSQELLERAALEGAMQTLAEDAEDLAARQEEWNQEVGKGEESPPKQLAQSEQAMAEEADRLGEEVEEVQEALDRQDRPSEEMDASQQRLGQASEQMRQAASQAEQGQNQRAQQSGERASSELNPVAENLRSQLDEMREDFREEVLEEMDNALTETADLARRQQDVTNRLERGQVGSDVRGEQAALRESVDRVIERLKNAAGKNALVSPNLSTALGFARLRMSEALSQFEQPAPNTRQAGELAAQAVDGLNAVASALLRNRDDVAGSSSGSGMPEAMQRMAEMAGEQESLNGQTSSLMPLMPTGGKQLLQQLEAIAQQQRSLGDQLERLSAEDAVPGAAEELAEEAQEIARELEAGRLDRETLERQERLFRRMLDAGRSLESDAEDERLERQSETARADNFVLPEALDPDALGETKFPYPAWEQLQHFSPEERRLILDYFRRLNSGRP